MAKFLEKEKAIKLRLKGNSISDIANQLNVSKSTVSLWCRDISLSEDAILQISKNSFSKSTSSLLKYTESLRAKRQINTKLDYDKGAILVSNLSDRDIYCIGLGLYWGEGYKRGSQEFGFTNSDYKMVCFYIKWLEVVFGVYPKDLIFRISINEIHKDRVEQVLSFWTDLLNVPATSFTKTSLIRSASKKIYSTSDSHFGTLRVKVRKGTRMRREILGSIASIGDRFCDLGT